MSAAPEITVAELAARLGAAFEGDGARRLRSVATLAEAGPDALAWLGNPDYLPQLASTRAAAVLVPADCTVPPWLTVIRVDDPDLAMCRVLGLFAPQPPVVPPGVHPSAVIEAGAVVEGAAIAAHVVVGARARLGPGTQLHPGVYIGPDSTIGRDCVLWHNVVVRERVTIGDRVVIHPNSTIGADGFGYLQRGGRNIKIPQVGTVVIEDDVEIGANVTIDRARSGVTRVRRGVKVDNLVQIGHNCDIGEDSILVAQVGLSGSVTLGRGVMLAGQVGVADHIRIGDGAKIGAQAGLIGDVPAGAAWIGSPAMDGRAFWRQMAALKRLPKWFEQFRELVRRVERLESAANDST
jgi:UDP-3-O-[3-hydroxymyristoyl] glucosamine N-acyltransferase